MQLRKTENRTIFLLLIIILLLSLIIRIIPFISEEPGQISGGYAQDQDALAIIYDAGHIILNGEISKVDTLHGHGFSPPPYSIRETMYHPLSSILLSLFTFFTGVPPYKINSVVVILLSLILTFSIFVVSREILENNMLALLSAFFATTLTVIGRDIAWGSPHIFQGYLIFLLALFGFFKFYKLKEKKWIFFTLVLLLALAYTHLLPLLMIVSSLFIFTLVAALKSKNKKTIVVFFIIFFILYFVGIIFSHAIITGFGGRGYTFSKSLIEVLYQYSDESLIEISAPRPLWDHPSVWGSVLTVLGIYGLLHYAINRRTLWGLLLLLFFVPILLGNLHYIGVYFYSFRWILYAWIPLVIMAPFGLKLIIQKFKKPKSKLNVVIPLLLIFLIVLSTTIHAINYQESACKAYPELLKKFPPDDHISGMYWIKDNTPENSTISVSLIPDHCFVTWLPIISERNATFGWYISDPKEPSMEKNELLPTGLIGKFITPFIDEDLITRKKRAVWRSWKRKYNPHIMLKNPDSAESQRLMNEYNIWYVYTWKNSPYDITFQDAKKFEGVYEKGEVRIYARKFNLQS